MYIIKNDIYVASFNLNVMKMALNNNKLTKKVSQQYFLN